LVEADRLTGVELIGGPVIARTAVFIRPVNQPHPHRQGFVIPDDYDSGRKIPFGSAGACHMG